MKQTNKHVEMLKQKKKKMEKNKMETFVFIFTPTTFNLRVLQTIEKKMKSPTKMRRQLKPQNPESIFFV